MVSRFNIRMIDYQGPNTPRFGLTLVDYELTLPRDYSTSFELKKKSKKMFEFFVCKFVRKNIRLVLIRFVGSFENF